MKTEISLPNELFSIAEKYALEHGLSRNELYTAAIRAYLKKLEKKEVRDITQTINRLLDDVDIPFDPLISAAIRKILLESEFCNQCQSDCHGRQKLAL